MKRSTWVMLALLALAVAHMLFWYMSRERAVEPRLDLAAAAAAAARQGASGSGAPIDPRQLLAGGDYDVCVWIPYPHQNLGVFAAAVGDLPEVIGAAARLARGEGSAAGGGAGAAGSGGGKAGSGAGTAGSGANDAFEIPGFGPFEVPPASELTACSDLAGGRLRVAARIYPSLALVARLAGRLAGNPWLAGGTAGRMRVSWDGRLWNVIAGPASPAGPATFASGAGDPAAVEVQPPADLPASLAVVHWRGDRGEIPRGYYTLTRQDADLVFALAGGAPQSPGEETLPGVASAGGATLLVAAGPGWRQSAGGGTLAGGAVGADGADGAAASAIPSNAMPEILFPNGAMTSTPGHRRRGARAARGGGDASDASDAGRGQPSAVQGQNAAGAGAGDAEPRQAAPGANPGGAPGQPPSAAAAGAPPGAGWRRLPPAAMAIFETGGSRLTSLGDLPGLAVFNVAPATRWHLPAESIFRFFSGRMPAADVAGWHIVGLDPPSLRQATALAPRLTALVPPQSAPAAIAAAPSAAVPGAEPPPAAARGALGTGSPAVATPGARGTAAPAAATAAPHPAGAAAPASDNTLSLGVWLDPVAAFRMVSRIRKFVEGFPLASANEVALWRDWETVLDPLANCDRASLTASVAAPRPRLRLVLQSCSLAHR